MPTAIRQLPTIPNSVWAWTIAVSCVVHLSVGAFVGSTNQYSEKKIEKVRIRVADPVAPPLVPIEPKPKEKPKRTEKKLPTPNQKVVEPVVAAPPIQGLTKESVSDKGTMSAPVGNTLMVEDTGKRMNPDDVKPLAGDLSSPAILQRESIQIPAYTEQAIDASLEGSWMVDVYVGLNGQVSDAELRKKIGYGMDERVLAAARAAKFIPRKNKFGVSEAGWAEIKFTLVLP